MCASRCVSGGDSRVRHACLPAAGQPRSIAARLPGCAAVLHGPRRDGGRVVAAHPCASALYALTATHSNKRRLPRATPRPHCRAPRSLLRSRRERRSGERSPRRGVMSCPHFIRPRQALRLHLALDARRQKYHDKRHNRTACPDPGGCTPREGRMPCAPTHPRSAALVGADGNPPAAGRRHPCRAPSSRARFASLTRR